MFSVYILWGAYLEPGDRPVRYDFSTQAELNAFLRGVDEGVGWMDYSVRRDDTPYSVTEDGDDAEV